MSIFTRNEPFRVFAKQYPVTLIMILLNTLAYLVLSLNGGSTNTQTLLKLGALYPPLVAEGEWYRLISSMFLHIGFEHFFFNLFSIYIFGTALEKTVGPSRYTFIYIMSGLGGSLLVTMTQLNTIVAGASGSIFGIFGAFIAIILRNKKDIARNDKQIIFVMLGLNIVFTFLGRGVSVEGHIGGLVMGVISAMLLLKRN